MANQWRGYALRAMVGWVERTLEPDASARVLEAVPAEILQRAQTIKASVWVDESDVDALVWAVAENAGDDDERFRRIVLLGESVAHEATNTFLRLIMRMLTPTLLARRLPDFFRHDVRGAKLTAELVEGRMDGRVENSTVRYMGALAVGFIGYVMRTMGCRDIQGEADMSDPHLEPHTFVLRWTR